MTTPDDALIEEHDGPELTYAAIACTLELSRIRSMMLVGMALVDKCPTEETWWGLLSDPEYIESLNALAEIINDMQVDANFFAASDTPDGTARAAENHHARAVEAVSVVADRLGIPPEDLISVLVHA